jgi:Domain of unknown function (DUF1992)
MDSEVRDMDDRELAEQRRLRRAAVTRFGVLPDDVPTSADAAEDEHEEDDNAASKRMDQKTLWVDLQVRRSIERGEFDNLPGAGKPLKLPAQHDPDWWVKRLIEREKISGVAPPAIGLRREDAELDEVIDREWSEEGVRRIVADFNRRVVEARRQLTGGPPVLTRTRDADDEVASWAARRESRRELGRQRAAAERASAQAAAAGPRSLLDRLRRGRRARPSDA